ncbi:MAG: LysR family transcriptional regulator [Microbacteriaceae bacterium]|nr:LysR family transcriptional regulator [Microbacteriaceae bacterium]
MELRRLEHFVAVAEERNFTRASRRLNLVQSALSVSIKTLERELGTDLFRRTTHQVDLTDAGHVLLPEARKTIAAAEAAWDAVNSAIGGLRGTLRLGIMQSLGVIDLAGLLTRFHRERPGVQLLPRPTSGGSTELILDVERDELDLAFVSVPGHLHAPAGIELIALASDPILLAVPPGHPLESRPVVSIEELDGETFVESPSGWGTRLATDLAFARANAQRQVTVEVADLSTLAELVSAGLGLGFLPRSGRVDQSKIRLVPVQPSLALDISLAIPSHRNLSAVSRAFIGLVKQESNGG